MKKAIGMFAALTIALAMSGVAFAHWSEYLYADIDVTTGTLCMEWEVHHLSTDPTGVATIEYCLVDTDEDGCDDSLYINVFNAYPCLDIWGAIDIHNCGTIPAALYNHSIDICDYPEDWLCDALDVCEYTFTGNCDRIDPCEELDLNFHIHFGEDTPEGAYAYIDISLEFVNWNQAL